ncbi:MAG: site-2 protease family protein [Microgenomates group bacterium]
MRYNEISMLLSLLFTDPFSFIVIAGALLISLSVHEFAHAWTADKLGDPTPRHQGRVTLDPRAHLDPIGTLAILLIGFGWGKPVMFDPYNLRNPVKDASLIALAGPVSNLILAVLVSLIATVIPPIGIFTAPVIASIASAVVFLNVMLAIFNLVPIHPLDGSKILLALLPEDTAYEYETFMRKNGTFVLLALLIPWGGGASPISLLISPIIQTVVGFLL